ncbi:hypothetical protein M0813_22262 [Anaeramoeba flamelloides]|uniref:Uncharacterized protein n=1 Tax=Anaeramoeba flamelloides TaxID=1746091 RepID=A0ABQ8YFJ5_9EUKA|nr:hypothetical protein M0813_22262 [Anaeramoeba flamelloides]
MPAWPGHWPPAWPGLACLACTTCLAWPAACWLQRTCLPANCLHTACPAWPGRLCLAWPGLAWPGLPA